MLLTKRNEHTNYIYRESFLHPRVHLRAALQVKLLLKYVIQLVDLLFPPQLLTNALPHALESAVPRATIELIFQRALIKREGVLVLVVTHFFFLF